MFNFIMQKFNSYELKNKNEILNRKLELEIEKNKRLEYNISKLKIEFATRLNYKNIIYSKISNDEIEDLLGEVSNLKILSKVIKNIQYQILIDNISSNLDVKEHSYKIGGIDFGNTLLLKLTELHNKKYENNKSKEKEKEKELDKNNNNN